MISEQTKVLPNSSGKITTTIAGETVVVRGAVVEGIIKIGTAFIP